MRVSTQVAGEGGGALVFRAKVEKVWRPIQGVCSLFVSKCNIQSQSVYSSPEWSFFCWRRLCWMQSWNQQTAFCCKGFYFQWVWRRSGGNLDLSPSASSSVESSSFAMSQTPYKFEVQYKTVPAGEGETRSSLCLFFSFFFNEIHRTQALCVCLHNHSIIGASLPGDTALNFAKSGWHLYVSEVNKRRRICPSDKQTHTGAVSAYRSIKIRLGTYFKSARMTCEWPQFHMRTSYMNCDLLPY